MKKWIALLTVVFATATASVFANQNGSQRVRWNHMEKWMEHMQEMKVAYKTAIENNDFEAFQALKDEAKVKMKEKHEEMKMKREAWVYKKFSDKDHEDKAKMWFDKAVTHYQEHGEHLQKHGKRAYERTGKYFRSKERGLVKAALKDTNQERLVKVLERIDSLTENLDDTTDEKILDMLLWIREVIQEKMEG